MYYVTTSIEFKVNGEKSPFEDEVACHKFHNVNDALFYLAELDDYKYEETALVSDWQSVPGSEAKMRKKVELLDGPALANVVSIPWLLEGLAV